MRVKVEVEVQPTNFGWYATGKIEDAYITGEGRTSKKAEEAFIKKAKEFLTRERAYTKTIELEL